MQREPDPGAPAPSPEQLALELARIEASPPFRGSARHRALLRHLVDRALQGDTAALKESVIAVEVFGRPADRFDPRQDTIVRVEARRLRTRLAAYYRGSGCHAAWRITLPVGSYVPEIAPAPVRPAPAVSRRARDLAERGEHFLRQPLGPDNLRAALERFDAALAECPNFTPAHVGRGRALLNLATGWHADPAEAAAEAGRALRRAVDLDPAQPVAWALLGALASQFERDWPAARRAFQQALALGPQEAFVHSAWGCHLRMHGRFDEAEGALQQARRLDPHYVNTRMHLVNLRIGQRRFDDALAEAEALRDVAGTTLGSTGLLAAIALYRGDTASAIAGLEELHAALPDQPAVALTLAGALAAAGHDARADALADALPARFDLSRLSPYVQAIYAVRRRRPDAALGHLAAAIERRDPLAVQIPDEPAFDPLHPAAGWPALVKRSRRP